MNPRHLQTFLAVCEHLNYTRAAESIYLSQPAVSRQVQQLEKRVGVALFEQIGKSLSLTDAGRALSVDARRLLAMHDHIVERMGAFQKGMAGRLRIGAGTTPGCYLLPPIVGRFCDAYPGVELRYAVEGSRRIEQMILRNELDVGFVGAEPTEREIVAEDIADDRIVCFASARHALAGRSRISVKTLSQQTWVLREKDSATRQLFERWLLAGGGHFGNTIELGSLEGVRELVAGGVGISCGSSRAIETDVDAGRVVILRIPRLKLSRSIQMIRHIDKHATPVLRAFIDLVRSDAHA